MGGQHSEPTASWEEYSGLVIIDGFPELIVMTTQ